MNKRQGKAPAKPPVGKGAAIAPRRTSQGTVGSRRLPLPHCRTCTDRLTRAAKNAGHKICDRCSSRITESTVTFTLARAKA